METKRGIALEALDGGMPMHLVASYVGVTVEQVRIWKESARHDGDPIMAAHYAGLAPSQIARRLAMAERDVRSHITAVWKRDKEEKGR